MDLNRIRQLAGLEPIAQTLIEGVEHKEIEMNEAEMDIDQKIAAFEKQMKDEVDPRARSAIKWKLDELKKQKAGK